MFIYQHHCSCSEGDVIVLPWGYLIYEPASTDDDDHDGVQTWKANFDPGGAEGGRGHCIMWGRKKGPPLVLFIYLVWQYAHYIPHLNEKDSLSYYLTRRPYTWSE